MDAQQTKQFTANLTLMRMSAYGAGENSLSSPPNTEWAKFYRTVFDGAVAILKTLLPSINLEDFETQVGRYASQPNEVRIAPPDGPAPAKIGDQFTLVGTVYDRAGQLMPTEKVTWEAPIGVFFYTIDPADPNIAHFIVAGAGEDIEIRARARNQKVGGLVYTIKQP